MARKSIEERLAQLEAQKKTLKARLGKQERARDTRRKVLLGALVLHQLEDDKNPANAARITEWLKRDLPGFLTRDIDRMLFPDLVPQPAESETGNRDGTETDQGQEEKDNDGFDETEPDSGRSL